MASEIWSAILSGWPSVTDSEVNKNRSLNFLFLPIEGIFKFAGLPRWLFLYRINPQRRAKLAHLKIVRMPASAQHPHRQALACQAHLYMVIAAAVRRQRLAAMGPGARSRATLVR